MSGLGAVFAWAFLAAGGPPVGCQHLTAHQWWTDEAYIGFTKVEDFPPERFGCSLETPQLCYCANLTELSDSAERVRGYQDVIAIFRDHLAGDVSHLRMPEGEIKPGLRQAWPALTWNRLQELVGRRFESLGEFDDWYDGASEFMVWSAERGTLAVDEDAKRDGRILVPRGRRELTGEEFWLYQQTGNFKVTREVSGYLQGYAVINGWPFQIAKTAAAERKAKRRGLIAALDAQQSGDLKQKPDGIRELEKLAGHSMPSAQSWQQWWSSLNKNRLQLSADGSRLVIK